MVETALWSFRSDRVLEGFQWLNYRQDQFGELPDWLNRPEYKLHEQGGHLHIFVPLGKGGRTMVVHPLDFVLKGLDETPFVLRKEIFEQIAMFVPRNPANLLDPKAPIESYVIRGSVSNSHNLVVDSTSV